SWSKPTPECKRDVPPAGPHGACGEPPRIDNGMHNGTKDTVFIPGSIVVYKCRDGFTLAGAASIHCEVGPQHRGAWSKPHPECRGDSYVSCFFSVFKIPLFLLSLPM
ncbi:DAF factor, partial [Turnix velox]|nr:DAF factor [Turnix velox]